MSKTSNPNPLFPAQNLVSLHYKNSKNYEYNHWLNNFKDSQYFDIFVDNGLRVFLNKFGYKISLSTKTVVKYLKEWLFSIVYTQNHKSFNFNREFVYCYHSGTVEDFDYYTFKISPDDWEQFLDCWKQTEFFDDSDPGFEQISEFYIFVWRIIDLYNSKTYIKYMETLYNDEDNLDDSGQIYHQHLDEHGAYGGDRRTY